MALTARAHPRQFLPTNLHPSIRPSPSNAARFYLPNPAIVTIDHRRRAPLRHPPRSNPHSPRRAATARPIAVSSLGGFRTPALAWVRVAPPVMGPGRHPKTFTEPAVGHQLAHDERASRVRQRSPRPLRPDRTGHGPCSCRPLSYVRGEPASSKNKLAGTDCGAYTKARGHRFRVATCRRGSGLRACGRASVRLT